MGIHEQSAPCLGTGGWLCCQCDGQGSQVHSGNEKVTYVCIGKVEPTENLVHEPLEGLSRVSEAKWHVHELKKAERHSNSGFVDICWLNRGLVIRSH